MAEKDTQVNEPAPGSQTATPEATPQPNPDAAAELAETRRKNEELSKQLADKDRFITDLKSEKETLEARFSQINRPKTEPVVDADSKAIATEILETAQVDPQKAGEKLAEAMKNVATKAQEEVLRRLGPIIEQQTYINEVKSKNQDLVDLGLEPTITLKAQQLIQTGKDFKVAIDTAVKEAREKVERLKSNTPPAATPKGAVGETGANLETPPPPPAKETTPEDEIAERRAQYHKKGL